MQTKTNNRVYAGFFVRLAAYLIDWLIVGTALLIVKVPVWFLSLSVPNNILVRDFIFQYSIVDIVIYVLTVLYFILLTYFTGATLGKRLFHLRVVSVEDRNPSFFEIIYRETVGKFLSGIVLCIGYLMIGLDGKNRGLHDILADTYVVYCHVKRRYVAPPVVYRDNAAVSPSVAYHDSDASISPSVAYHDSDASISPSIAYHDSDAAVSPQEPAGTSFSDDPHNDLHE